MPSEGRAPNKQPMSTAELCSLSFSRLCPSASTCARAQPQGRSNQWWHHPYSTCTVLPLVWPHRSPLLHSLAEWRESVGIDLELRCVISLSKFWSQPLNAFLCTHVWESSQQKQRISRVSTRNGCSLALAGTKLPDTKARHYLKPPMPLDRCSVRVGT
jgi:hypothetical protein